MVTDVLEDLNLLLQGQAGQEDPEYEDITIPEDLNIQERRFEKLKPRPEHSSPNVGNNVRPVKR